jgi:hypothetical protein
MLRSRQRLAAVIAGAALSATACATTTHGSPHLVGALSTPHFPKPAPSSATAPSFPSSAAPSAPAPSAPATTAALPAIHTVHFSRPSGFAKSENLQLVDPIVPRYQAEFLAPATEAAGRKDALAVVLYDLPAGSRPATAAEQEAFLARYNSAHQVSVTDGIRPHRIGGYPGFSVLADQPPDYHYLGYYVFGESQLVSITCQYDQHPSLVVNACGRLLGTVRFSG